MRCLDKDEAAQHLAEIHVTVGGHSELKPLDNSAIAWVHCRAPHNALELYSFAFHISSWLAVGDWKLLQIDDSNSFATDEIFLFSTLAGLSPVEATTYNSFVLEYRGAESERLRNEMTIANLIHIFLLFVGHCYIASSATPGRLLGLQDGFAYFISNDEGLRSAKAVLEQFHRDRLTLSI